MTPSGAGLRRAALLAVSFALLVWLWHDVGGGALASLLRELDAAWFGAALFLFVPTTLVTAWRWQIVAADTRVLGLGEALRMVLAASAANLFLPAKLGDVGKGAFLAEGPDGGGRAEGLALALFEKLADVAALAFWMVVACFFLPPVREAEQIAFVVGLGIVSSFGILCLVPIGGGSADDESDEAGVIRRAFRGVALLRANPRRFALVLASSLLLWGLHLLQFQCAAWAAASDAAPAFLASRIPMAIFVGLLPISFAGVGTRDAALLYLLGPFLGEPVALALGAFATLRYLVPAAAGMLSISGFGPSRAG
ncbi:MAG: flippase-like domain-containing protein [Deltaproteobacteria bacterium]|nr:flippase-like domain-containing protein [Deltaproteobacteria bacterium]MBW2444972.1 flippase-like domain-containing protein [Deltaproteobacteria bacterium]